MAQRYMPGQSSSSGGGDDSLHGGGYSSGANSRARLRAASNRAGGTLNDIDDLLNDPAAGTAGKDPSGFNKDVYDDHATRSNLRDQEKSAGSKEPGSGTPSPEELADEEDNPEEDDDFYNESADKPRQRRLTFRQKAAVTGGLALGVLGGGFGLGTIVSGPLQFIHLAQMLENFHLNMPDNQMRHRMGKIMQYIKKQGDEESKKPLTEQNRTRLSRVGAVFAGRFEKKLRAAGITANLGGNGKFIGWSIDAKKILPDKDLNHMSQAEIRANLEGRLGITIDNKDGGADHMFTLTKTANNLGYYGGNRFIYNMARSLGYSKIIGGLHARLVGKLTGVGWHPMQAAKEKYKGKITTTMKKFYRERLLKLVRGLNYKPSSIITKGGKDTNAKEWGELADGGYNSDPNDLKARKGILDKLNEKFDPLSDSVSGTIKGALLSVKVMEAICGLYTLAKLWDKIKFALLAVPMMNMAIEGIATGNQIMDNNNPASSTPELDMGKMAYMASLLHDNKTGSTWSDATSISGELGRSVDNGGPNDLPDYLKPGPDSGGGFLKFVNGGLSSSTLGSVCALIGTTAYQIVFTVADAVITILTLGASTGIKEALIQGAKVLVKQLAKFILIPIIITQVKETDTFKQLIGQLTALLAGILVNPEAKGALRGNFMNYGAKMFANGQGISNGGGALSQKQTADLKRADDQILNDEFEQKSFASRLFDTTDYRSAISRVIDSQASSPRAEFARMGHGLLNFGQSMASMPLKLLTGVTHAAPFGPYDYGFGDYGYTASEMDNPDLDDPFENARIVHDIMSNQDQLGLEYPGMTVQSTYAQRADYCYGKVISQPKNPDDPLTVKDDVQSGPPDYATIKNYPSSVIIGGTALDGLLLSTPFTIFAEANNLTLATTYTVSGSDGVGQGTCNDPSLDWQRIRMFIMDTNSMNAMACAETRDMDAKAKDKPTQDLATEGKQACTDIGYDGGGGASGGGDCAQGLPQGDDGPFHQIFSDDFTVASAIGSWGTSDASKVVYTGDHQGKWVEYPDGWPSTYGGNGYHPAENVSTHDSYLDIHFQNGSGANPSPLIDGTQQYQTYGRYTMCMKADPGLGGYYIVPLLWPQDEGSWSCAESDFPEGMADGEVQGFAHNCANGQDVLDGGGAKFTDWHVYTQDWQPGKRTYYVDGKKVAESTNAVYSGPERWQLQFEPNGGGPGGHVLVDWVAVYSYSG